MPEQQILLHKQSDVNVLNNRSEHPGPIQKIPTLVLPGMEPGPSIARAHSATSSAIKVRYN